MSFLIGLLLVVLCLGIFASAIGAIIDFLINAIGWIVVIGLVIGGVLMFSAGLGWLSAIPIVLGLALAGRG